MGTDNVVERLRESYDFGAAERDTHSKEPWKVAERAAFLDRLKAEGRQRLLEIGAGTGQDSLFFQEQGLSVVATDLSPRMVAHCRAKGLDARVMDFWSMDFPPASFDAVYALNCLLHVPNAQLPGVLQGIRAILRPGGLFFMGVYGSGESSEGVNERDNHRPPRFFSWRTDEQIVEFASAAFTIEDFHVAQAGEHRCQCMTLRVPDDICTDGGVPSDR
ncbi:MAG TPA: class I SAM-dependent methyltransferase [Candidatus Limnocylindrales bacterium]